jgi:pyruvate kinase
MKKKTKIVATIGPATESEAVLTKLLKAGMNVMRLNFSHGDFAEHQNKVDNLKKVIKKTGIRAAILQDLSGPKFRIGNFYQEKVILEAGKQIILTPDDIVGDEKRVSMNYPTLADELQVGSIVMVDDGKKKFEVVSIQGRDVVCKILIGGETKGRRGVNLPGAYLKISSLTDKDKADLAFGIKNNVDFVAFSFVRTAEDVLELRGLLHKGKSTAKIISKIETQEGVDNFDSILEMSDAIMVARGDLAVEIGAENVPPIQKMMIQKCNEAGKPVITATQMLESMINSSVPTRAEVSDVANAIFDGTDAVMLSEETTLGKFPVEAVEVMSRVALQTESNIFYRERILETQDKKHQTIGMRTADAVTNEAVDIANAIHAKAIVALTHSGFTAQMISRYKPFQPILALTPNEIVSNQLCLSFGVESVPVKKFRTLNEALAIIRTHCLKSNKLANKGDKVVIALGHPFGKHVSTNMILVETL